MKYRVLTKKDRIRRFDQYQFAGVPDEWHEVNYGHSIGFTVEEQLAKENNYATAFRRPVEVENVNEAVVLIRPLLVGDNGTYIKDGTKMICRICGGVIENTATKFDGAHEKDCLFKSALGFLENLAGMPVTNWR